MAIPISSSSRSYGWKFRGCMERRRVKYLGKLLGFTRHQLQSRGYIKVERGTVARWHPESSPHVFTFVDRGGEDPPWLIRSFSSLLYLE